MNKNTQSRITKSILGLCAMASVGVGSDALAAGFPYWTPAGNGCGTAIAQGWVVGCTASDQKGDYSIYENWPGTANWVEQGAPQGAVFITSDFDGNPWIIDAVGSIYDWDSVTSSFVLITDSESGQSVWTTVAVGDPSLANDVWATRADGSIWNLNPLVLGSEWLPARGTARKIAMFNEEILCTNAEGNQVQMHTPFVIGEPGSLGNQSIWQYQQASSSECQTGPACQGGCFNPVPGLAADIASGYVLGHDNNVYAWNGSGWSEYLSNPGGGLTIAAIGGGASSLWGLMNPLGGGNNIQKVLISSGTPPKPVQ